MERSLMVFFVFLFGLELMAKDDNDFTGSWEKNPVIKSIVQDIPFHLDLYNDIIIITNETPDRDIHCEIMDEKGQVIKSYEVSKEHSSRMVLSVSELPEHQSYMIVLTSPNPMDRVYSTFEK